MSAGDEDLDQLRFDNAERKREVAKLTEEMDKINHRRHKRDKKGTKEADSKLNLVTAEVRIGIKQNEDLRRERLKLTAELQHSDTGRRISEIKNELRYVEKQLELKTAELKALEYQKRMRAEIVEMAHHNEDELRLFRAQHREALNSFKDEALNLTEEQKALDRQMIAMQVAIHRISEKIKLGCNGDAFSELKEKVAQQEQDIAALNEKIAAAADKLERDTRREEADLKGLRQDRQALRDRIETLKQTQFDRERELKISYALTGAKTLPANSPRPQVPPTSA